MLRPDYGEKKSVTRNHLDTDLGFLIHDVARFMRRKFDQEVRSTGLTRAQWWVLVELLRANGQTQSELADNMELDKATLSSLIDKLEGAELVERRADPRDRRIKRVFRTGKAGAIIPVLDKAGQTLYRQALDGLDQDNREALFGLLSRIKQNLIVNSADAAQDQSRRSEPLTT